MFQLSGLYCSFRPLSPPARQCEAEGYRFRGGGLELGFGVWGLVLTVWSFGFVAQALGSGVQG